jgi:hypothetical protein
LMTAARLGQCSFALASHLLRGDNTPVWSG